MKVKEFQSIIQLDRVIHTAILPRATTQKKKKILHCEREKKLQPVSTILYFQQ